MANGRQLARPKHYGELKLDFTMLHKELRKKNRNKPLNGSFNSAFGLLTCMVYPRAGTYFPAYDSPERYRSPF